MYSLFLLYAVFKPWKPNSLNQNFSKKKIASAEKLIRAFNTIRPQTADWFNWLLNLDTRPTAFMDEEQVAEAAAIARRSGKWRLWNETSNVFDLTRLWSVHAIKWTAILSRTNVKGAGSDVIVLQLFHSSLQLHLISHFVYQTSLRYWGICNLFLMNYEHGYDCMQATGEMMC